MSEWISRPATETRVVGVRVPADLSQLTMLRALAETVSLIAEFAVDEVTDIRVALDEVATALIVAALPDGAVECEFEFDERGIKVRAESVVTVPDALDEHGFAWQVLATITEDLAAQRKPFDSDLGGYPISVEFSQLRTGSGPR
ncbi:ATP-binding protein [Nocardia jejuensis]|uniref:ATP-binding protein n=1 Tax=Nocardia jejuensis TaxID=328049 RepID=UPI00082A2FB9|nr:anti-sigma factor [Nocardia jejuensis]